MRLRAFLLTALAAGGLIAAAPQTASARTYITINTGTQCQDFRRSFIDNRGYERVSYGTACQQPNGAWMVTSENVVPLVRTQRVVYRDVPIYAPPSAIIVSDPYRYGYPRHGYGYHRDWDHDHDRWDHWDHRDHDDWRYNH
jgi:hypothetical protein